MMTDTIEALNEEARRLTAQVGGASTVEEVEGIQDLLTVWAGRLSAIASSVPSYDLRAALALQRAATDACVMRREQLTPRQPFKFVSRRPRVTGERDKEVSDIAPPTTSTRSIDPNAFSLIGKCNITTESQQTGSYPVLLADLTNCDITINGTVSQAQLVDLRRCVVRLQAVKSSVFVARCIECRIIAACRQLRVHSTADTTFSIWAVTTPIIEDSRSLVFEPHDVPASSLEVAGLNTAINQWSNVQDFSWLRSNEPSPNFKCATTNP